MTQPLLIHREVHSKQQEEQGSILDMGAHLACVWNPKETSEVGGK